MGTAMILSPRIWKSPVRNTPVAQMSVSTRITGNFLQCKITLCTKTATASAMAAALYGRAAVITSAGGGAVQLIA